MAKQSKTYRLPEDTVGKIEALSKLFNESGAELVERAVNFLDREKELEVKYEHDLRLGQAKSK